MLILTRLDHEVIIVKHAGEELRIMILPNVHGKRKRLGFDGPQSFKVLREEVQDDEQP